MGDLGEGVGPIAGVDPLGRVSHEEVGATPQPGGVLQRWDALLLGCAGVDRRLVDDDIAAAQVGPHRPGRCQQVAEDGLLGVVDGRGDGYDVEVRAVQVPGVRGIGDHGGRELLRVHLPGPVEALGKLRDAPAVDVESHHQPAPAKGDGQPEPHVAEADYRDSSAGGSHPTAGVRRWCRAARCSS